MTIVIDAGNILYWLAIFTVVCLGLAIVARALPWPPGAPHEPRQPRPRRRVTRAGLIEAGVWFVIIFGGLAW